MEKLVNQEKKDFLESRKGRLGGSDIATILGFNKWKTPYKLWQEKTGKVELDYNESERARWGNLLESTIADEFSERNEMKLINYKKPFVDKQNEKMVANLDRAIVDQGDGRGPGLLEIKTVDKFVYDSENWEDGFPDQYWLQVQWYFMITGYKWGYFAILVGGNTYVQVPIAPDPKLIKIIRDAAENWISMHLIDDIAPEKEAPDWKETISNPDTILEATEDQFHIYEELKQAHFDYTSAKKRKDELSIKLIEIMRDNEILAYGTKKLATYKSGKRKQFQQSKLKELKPDVYEQFTDEVNTRTLRPNYK